MSLPVMVSVPLLASCYITEWRFFFLFPWTHLLDFIPKTQESSSTRKNTGGHFWILALKFYVLPSAPSLRFQIYRFSRFYTFNLHRDYIRQFLCSTNDNSNEGQKCHNYFPQYPLDLFFLQHQSWKTISMKTIVKTVAQSIEISVNRLQLAHQRSFLMDN